MDESTVATTITDVSVTEITVVSLVTPLAASRERADVYIAQSKAGATMRAYRADWSDFTNWCECHGLASLPADPGTVALYLADAAEVSKVATLIRRMAAISKAHQAAGLESPAAMKHACVSEVLKGIKRAHGTAQSQKSPVLVDDLRRMVATLECMTNGLLATRDRALLLLGFAGAFRRSELVALNADDLKFDSNGLTVTLRRSKTDQEGHGRAVAIPYGSNPATCPVRAMLAWIEASQLVCGAVFCPINRHGQKSTARLSDHSVALVVKRYAAAAGIDPTTYAGHSLRAGLVTEAARGGASDRSIMKQTGHKSRAMVDRYVREANRFQDNAAAKVGL